MKSHLITSVIALVTGYFGGYLASLNFSEQPVSQPLAGYQQTAQNPFKIQSTANHSDALLASLQSKIESLQIQVSTLQSTQNKIKTLSKSNTHDEKNKINARVTPNQKNLIASGISPDIADEILRRISQQDFRRLELQNLMQRSKPAERRQYSRELRELNKNRISLRTEMGDDPYDQYLFVSGQNNRVKVSSVMAGSPAETSGFQAEDIILYYDNQKILNWPDIRRVTVQGEIGSYTSVEILRNGAQMSLMVPRGTLGVQLDSVQLDPAQ
jgi:S1-C subfamily serine protease